MALPPSHCRLLRGLASLAQLSILTVLASAPVRAVTLQWDANPGTPGVQLGAGTWADAAANWRNVDTATDNVTWSNGSAYVARFGLDGSAFAANTITVTDTVNAAGLDFLGFTAAPTQAQGSGYIFNGGTIQLATGSVISIADNASSGNGFITFNGALAGQNLVIRKSGGTGIGFVALSGNNTGLTGTLTLSGVNGGTFLRPTAVAAVNSLSTIIVESGSTFASTISGTFVSNFVIGGEGQEQTAGAGDYRGALRVDSSSTQVFTGNFTLSDFGATINTSGGTATISGNIGEIEPGSLLTKKGDGTLTLSGTNTYTGGTMITGGTLALNFAAVGSPTSNIISSSSNMFLAGGGLLVTGADTGASSQAFAATYVNGFNTVTANAGASGTLSVNLGLIQRGGYGDHLRIVTTGSTTVLASNNGFVGAWASYKSGTVAGWAGVQGGVLGIFAGDLNYETGKTISSVTGYTATSNLGINGSSEGNITVAAGTTEINTISMAGKCDPRTIVLGAGDLIRFGNAGGIQVVGDAKSLTVGSAPGVGQITAGTTGATELILTNNSTTSTLTINAQIVDHGGGGSSGMDVIVNGTGNTILAGPGTYTGLTQVLSGSLEVTHNQALGAVGSGTVSRTIVSSGAALQVSGNLTNMAENLLLNGSGIATGGALRNVSGVNTVSGTISLGSAARISSDAGTLILSKGAGTSTTIIITGTQNLVFAGNGNIEVQSRIATSTGTVTKTGNGVLILSGDNNFSGAMTISGGTVRMTHTAALGTIAGSTTVSTGGTLEITGGISTTEGITINGAGFNNQGALLSTSGNNTFAGTIGLASSARINAAAGSTLALDVATGSAVSATFTSGTRTLTFGGEGTINVEDAITKGGTGGAIAIAKDGTGTTNLNAANTFNGGVSVSGGTLNLNAANAFTGAVAVSGGTLNLNVAASTVYTGTTTVSGGNLNVRSLSAGTTAVTLSGGQMHLDFTTSATAANATNLIGSASTLILNGGTLRLTGKDGGTNGQTLASLTVGSGTTNSAKSTIVVTGGTGGTASLNVGTILRNQNGHTVDFQIGAGATISGTSATTGTGGILLDGRGLNSVYATVNGNDWAAVSAGQIVGGESVTNFYTKSTSTTLAGNADADVALTTLAADTSVTSLRFDKALATTISGAIALKAGGILVTSDVGANDVTISNTSLAMNTTTNGGDLVIIQNNTAGRLIINSAIINPAAGAIALTKTGAGTLVLTGVSTFTGGTRVTEGTLELQGNNRLSASSGIQLGGGSTSAKLKLSGNQNFSNTVGLAISGTGTDNRVVGGLATLSTLTITSGGSQDFRNGFLGGSLTNENNLSFTTNLSTNTLLMQLGGANTYAGKTIVNRGILDVSVLANTGVQSSLGTGSFDAASSVITLGGSSTATATATLRYTGSTDSSTNRVVDLAGGATGTAATIQNSGSGTVKFTSAFTATGTSTEARQLTLSGTNTGINEIVGLVDGSAAVTNLIKAEAGTWAITGASTHSGTTTVNAGTLLANNATGSATGSGNVSVLGTSRLGGNGFIGSGTAAQNISVAGTAFLMVGNTGDTAAQSLNLSTSGVGVITLSGTIEFDIFGNSGGLNSLVSNDILILDSDTTVQISGSLKLTDTTNSSTCWELGDAWQLFDWLNVSAGTKVNGTFSSFVLPTLAEGLAWDTSNLYNNGYIYVAAVPEPGRMVLLGLALGMVGMRRRRKL